MQIFRLRPELFFPADPSSNGRTSVRDGAFRQIPPVTARKAHLASAPPKAKRDESSISRFEIKINDSVIYDFEVPYKQLGKTLTSRRDEGSSDLNRIELRLNGALLYDSQIGVTHLESIEGDPFDCENEMLSASQESDVVNSRLPSETLLVQTPAHTSTTLACLNFPEDSSYPSHGLQRLVKESVDESECELSQHVLNLVHMPRRPFSEEAIGSERANSPKPDTARSNEEESVPDDPTFQRHESVQTSPRYLTRQARPLSRELTLAWPPLTNYKCAVLFMQTLRDDDKPYGKANILLLDGNGGVGIVYQQITPNVESEFRVDANLMRALVTVADFLTNRPLLVVAERVSSPIDVDVDGKVTRHPTLGKAIAQMYPHWNQVVICRCPDLSEILLKLLFCCEAR